MRRISATLALRSWGLAVIGVLVPQIAHGQTGTVRMSADPSEVHVGETFSLEIRADVSGSQIGKVELPDLSPFEIVSQQVSRPFQIQLGFGAQQMVQASVVYQFQLRALREGTFELRPARIQVGHRALKSGPITIRVEAGGSDSVPDEPQTDDTPSAETQTISADAEGMRFDPQAFLRTVVDKAHPYVGEQVTMTLYLYVRGTLSHGGLRSPPTLRREPSTQGFWVQDLLPGSRTLRPTVQHVRGIPFYVYTLRRLAAFPLHEGELVIGAPEVTVEVGSLMDLFAGSGGPVERRGVPITIEAKPLPAPHADEAAVGSFEISAALEPRQVITGNAATLTVTVEGTGGIQHVNLSVDAIDGLRVLDPVVRDHVEVGSGTKVLATRVAEWIIVPQRPGNYELPPIGFMAFDPDTGQYARVETDPILLTAAGQGASAHDEVDDEPAQTSAPKAFAPIRTRLGATVDGPNGAESRLFRWALLVPPFFYLALVLFGAARRRARMRAQAGLRGAVAAARRRLDAARNVFEKSLDAPAFYALVAQALATALEGIVDSSFRSKTHEQVGEMLREAGLKEDTCAAFVEALREADRGRFGASEVPKDEMVDCMRRSEALLSDLAQHADRERPRNAKLAFWTSLLLGAAVFPLAGPPPYAHAARSLAGIFEDANQHYAAGEVDEAIRGYLEIVDADVSAPNVFFNLGTAYARRGEYGRAIWWFERALALDPDDEDARSGITAANMALIERRTGVRPEDTFDPARPFLVSITRGFSEDAAAWAVLCFNFALFLAFALRRLSRSRRVRVAMLSLGLAAGVGLALSTCALAIKARWYTDTDPAIVLQGSPLLEGPRPDAVERGSALAGDWAELLERRGAYVRVRLLDGSRGWLARSDVGLL